LSEVVLPVLASTRLLDAGRGAGRLLGRLGLHVGTDMAELAKGHASLADAESRAAFVHTLRTIVDPGGQRVSASDRLYLAQNVPFMIVWGERDPIIPVRHGRAAHELVPTSRLEVFENAGHFPHVDDPQRFLDVLLDFVHSTEPAKVDSEAWRDMVKSGR
jgi:pimeloyl-ACP methyl ester carboxylesterase